MNETFEQFCERMSKVEKTAEYVIGQAHQGNSRAVFEYEGHRCYLESWGFHCIPNLNKRRGLVTPAEMMWVASGNPHVEWVLADWLKGKSAAWKLAKPYGARACPDEYHEDDQDAWYLRFFGDEGFEKMLRVIFDYRNGVLPKETFPWRAAEEVQNDASAGQVGSEARDAAAV